MEGFAFYRMWPTDFQHDVRRLRVGVFVWKVGERFISGIREIRGRPILTTDFTEHTVSRSRNARVAVFPDWTAPTFLSGKAPAAGK